MLKPAYHFNAVHSFEPQPECCARIRRKFNAQSRTGACSRTRLVWRILTATRILYGKGAGASIFSDKEDIDSDVSARCRFVRTSSFFGGHIGGGDLVVMKLNCEGAETLILRDLVESEVIYLLANVMIDSDVRKIPSRWREENKIMALMAASGFKNHTTATRSMVGFSLQDRIRFWLSNMDCAGGFMELASDE